MTTTSAHYKKGSSFPPLKPGKLRVYSMAYCPFAHRARLVIAHKNIDADIVNVNLGEKPDWYLALNPLGQVPCIQLDEKRPSIPESLIDADYLDDVYQENRLTPLDPYTHAQQKLLVEAFGKKAIMPFYAFAKEPKAEQQEAFAKGLEEAVEQRITFGADEYFGGAQPAMCDFMMWPFIERITMLQEHFDFKLDAARFPKLIAYMALMNKHPTVVKAAIKPEILAKFLKGYFDKTFDMDDLDKLENRA